MLLILAAGAAARAQVITTTFENPRWPVAVHPVETWIVRPNGAPLRPVALASHPSGLLCGIEARRHRLFLLSERGDWVGFASSPPTQFSLHFYTELYAGPGLWLYALDPDGPALDLYNLQGRWEQRLDLRNLLQPLGGPALNLRDLCVDGAGTIYLLDGEGGGIYQLDADRARPRRLGDGSDWPLRGPAAIDVDGRGQLFVLTSQPPELLQLDPDGMVRTATRLPQPAGKGASGPWSLAVDRWGNAFVAAGDRPGLWMMAQERAPVRATLPETVQVAALTLDGLDRLLILDGATGTVLVCEVDHARREGGGAPPSR